MAFDNAGFAQGLSPLGGPALPLPISQDTADLLHALAAYGLPGAQDTVSLAGRLGLASAIDAYPSAAPDAGGDNQDGAPLPDPDLSTTAAGIVPPSTLVHDLPDLTVDPQVSSAQANVQGAPRDQTGAPGSADQHLYDRWTLPNGQVVRQYDAIQGPNVVYHHGDLDGQPGIYVDDPADPSHPGTVFTPTGPGFATTEHGFAPSPEIGPDGSPYYDKVVWREGPRAALLRVDAQGNPVKAFTLDAGEVRDAPGPTDFIGPGEVKLAADLAFAAATKAGAPLLLKGLGAKLVASNIVGEGERAAAEGGEAAAAGADEPIVQLGGAHRDVKKLTGYQSHHMPARSVSPLPVNDGPAIAMQPLDHQNTASWGRKGESFRRRQFELIQKGDFKGAQQMDIDDIRSRFGSKYDDAIGQMLDYTNKKGF